MTNIRTTALAAALTALALTLASGCGGGSGSSEDKIAVTPVSITSFGAAKSSLLYGERTTLSAVFSGGTGRVSPGDLAIQSGTPLEVQPTSTTTYTLTVTGGPGSTPQSRTVAVDVATVVVTTPSAGAAQIETGGTTTVTATVTGALDSGITWTASAGTITAGQGTGSITWTAPSSIQAVTFTATSVADPSKSASTQVQVVAVQVAPSSLTYPTIPTMHRGLGAPTLTPTVEGTAPMTFAVSPALPAVLSLNTTTGAISGTPTEEAIGTYTVTATNAVGSTSTQISLQVGNAPSLNFEVGTARINRGSSTILSWNAASGEGVYDRVALSAAPADPSLPTGTLPLDHVITVSPTAPSTTYTLTAFGAHGGQVQATQVIETTDETVAITDFTGPEWVSYGQGADLTWTLTGIPDTLTLNGENVLGSSTGTVYPRRRQTFTLEGRNAFGTASRTIEVAARGLDTWAGQPLAFGHRDGALDTAKFSFFSAKSGSMSAIVNISADSAGNIYFPDGNHVIRMISKNGQVSTIAGTSRVYGFQDGAAAQFYFPGQALVWEEDEGGNAKVIFVADRSNYVIRRLEKIGNAWTTSTECGVPGVPNDGVDSQKLGIPGALAKHNGILYIADQVLGILKYDPSLPEGSRISSAEASAIPNAINPTSLVVDADGSIFFTQNRNHNIAKINNNGEYSIVAGTGTPGFVDGNAQMAQFRYPSSLTLDPSGNILVADSGNLAIRRINKVTGEVTTLTGGTAGYAEGTLSEARFDSPQGLLYTPSGLLVVDDANGIIRRITEAQTEPFAGRRWSGSQDGQGEAAKFNRLTVLAAATDGTTYVTDVGNARVRRVSPTGEVTTLYTPATGVPTAVALDPAGQHLYVAIGNVNPGRIDCVSLTDGTAAPLPLSHPLGTATLGLAVSLDGQQIYTAEGTGRVRKYDIATGNRLAELLGQTGATRLAVAANGVFWTVNGTAQALVRRASLDLTGVETIVGTAGVGFADGAEGTAKLNQIQQLALKINDDGEATEIWIADSGNHSIRLLDLLSRTVWTLMGSPEEFGARTGALDGGAALSQPRGLAFTPKGDLLISTSDALMILTIPIPPQ